MHKNILLKLIVLISSFISYPVFGETPRSQPLYLLASNDKLPPYISSGTKEIGFWDVDNGGSYGTYTSSHGHYMMALIARMRNNNFPDNIDDIQLIASDSGEKPDPSAKPGYYLAGWWDVDQGGSKGTDGSTGNYNMSMYVKTSPVGEVGRLKDLLLSAGNDSQPPIVYAPYSLIGYWDVDKGGARGTGGSTGTYMVGLYGLYR